MSWILGAQAAEFHIYVNGSMSGARGYLGQSMLEGVSAQVQQINREGGLLGRKLKVIPQDDELDIEKAVLLSRRSMDDPEHLLTIGSSNSRIGLITSRLYHDRKKLFFTVFATHPDIGGLRGTVFQLCANNLFQGKLLADLAIKKLHARRVLVLTNQSDPYSEDLSRAFVQNLETRGPLISQLDYIAGKSILPAMQARIREFHPDLLFVPAIHDRAAEIVREINQNDLGDFEILGSDGWGAQDETAGIYQILDARKRNRRYFIPFHWYPSAPSSVGQKIAATIVKESARTSPPYAASVLAYEAMEQVKLAIRANRSEDAEIISNYLRGRRYPGATGPVTLTPSGETRRALVLLELTSRGYRFNSWVRPNP